MTDCVGEREKDGRVKMSTVSNLQFIFIFSV